MKPQKLPKTYAENVGDRRNDRSVVGTARITAEVGSLLLDGRNHGLDDIFGALVLLAAIYLGSDRAQLVAEVVETVRDIHSIPLRDDLGDSGGEGHRASGEDSEDGRETHGKEGGKESEKATWARNDWRC